MKELVVLVEEESMKRTLDILLPTLLPEDVYIRVIPHQGKSDLEASVPRKLRAWTNPQAKFIVMRDNDGGDCKKLKGKLSALCSSGGRPETLIRIVCQELESWFLGDLAAVEKSGISPDRNIARKQGKKTYKDPDRLGNAKEELRRIAPSYMPRTGSHAIAPHMSLDSNRSKSFQVFVGGVRRMIAEMEG
ncbi:MAG: DUF4276 family protein [Rhodospirillales bacterium]|jgi:hypothetical protein|nr:DUF4276 family protein [Rhodospirillales bacterium]